MFEETKVSKNFSKTDKIVVFPEIALIYLSKFPILLNGMIHFGFWVSKLIF